jgi:hypothetical protein
LKEFHFNTFSETQENAISFKPEQRFRCSIEIRSEEHSLGSMTSFIEIYEEMEVCDSFSDGGSPNSSTTMTGQTTEV